MENLLNSEIAKIILMVLVISNIAFSAVTQALEVLKKPLNPNHFAYKAIGLVQKAIDFLSANKKH
jgi:hypothetical protein